MEIQFLGGAETVTGSQFLVTTPRARVLVDCGMFQGTREESARNRIPFAFDASEIDAVVVTHSHIDHCGLVPHLVKHGFKGPFYATPAAIELIELVLLDSAKLQEEFAKRNQRRGDRRGGSERRGDGSQRGEAERRGGGERRTGYERRAAGLNEEVLLEHPELERVQLAARQAIEGELDSPLAAPDDATARVPNGELHDILDEPARFVAELDEPLYSVEDVERAIRLFRPLDYREPREVAHGVTATLFDAGHILGSAIVGLEVRERADEDSKLVVFSGDLGKPGSPIIRNPTLIRKADYLVVESTYGGRTHEPREDSVEGLAQAVRDVAERKGALLIPSFAVGRTQEVVWFLDRLVEARRIPRLPLFLDSPMASKASDIYRHYPEYYDAQARQMLAEQESPLDYEGAFVTRSVQDSKAIEERKPPYIIVASNGMLTGGRVVEHLANIVDNPRSILLFVGYQGTGTLGRQLEAGARQVSIYGQTLPVRCEIRKVSGFSAHADEPETLAWVSHFVEERRPGDEGVPRKVFVVHGEPESAELLAAKIRDMGLDPYIPHWRERVELD